MPSLEAGVDVNVRLRSDLRDRRHHADSHHRRSGPFFVSTATHSLARELFELSGVRRNISGYDFSVPNAVPPHRPLTGPTGRRVVEHRQELLEVLARHGVTNPEIFGSAARGDDREESDLDLLVDFAPGTDLFDMVRIKAELEEVLGAPVDLIPRDGLKERVRSGAAKDLVAL